MLNQELTGAVDFRKGCYPGQEVVARSQYRGTIKRRMFLFDTDGAAQAGDEVFWSGDPEQPAGLVVNAARGPDATTSALVEVKLAALDGGSLHLSRVGGALLRRVALPYPVPVSEAA
jgi:folate-binding Fe-S cluster repair protein YgfZ